MTIKELEEMLRTLYDHPASLYEQFLKLGENLELWGFQGSASAAYSELLPLMEKYFRPGGNREKIALNQDDADKTESLFQVFSDALKEDLQRTVSDRSLTSDDREYADLKEFSDSAEMLSAYMSLLCPTLCNNGAGREYYAYMADLGAEMAEEKANEIESENTAIINSISDRIKKSEEKKNASVDSLFANAQERADFSKYEYNTKLSKQALRDLCEQYRVYAGTEPEFKNLFSLLKEYSYLDAYAEKNYSKEVKLVKSIYEQLDKCRTKIDAENEKIIADQKKSFNPERFDKLTDEEKLALDKEFVYREEIADTRSALVASIGVYFDTLTNGGLEDPLFGSSAFLNNNEQIANEIKLHKGQIYTIDIQQGDAVVKAKYIDGTGVAIDQRVDSVEFGKTVYNLSSLGTKKKGRAGDPLFPHEPRMNDIQQVASGNCYMLSGLADLAKSRPQQIKDMLRDNGDGTVTVRFYERVGKKYTPVYVKVEKAIRTVAGMTEGGENCLWASVIEEAYVISGLHKEVMRRGSNYAAADKKLLDTQYDSAVLSMSLMKTQKEKDDFLELLKKEAPLLFDATGIFKKWEPALNDIYGGDTSMFLETCFGPKYKAFETDIIHQDDIAALALPNDFIEQNKSLDCSDPAAIVRALYFGENLDGFKASDGKTFRQLAEDCYEELEDWEKELSVSKDEFVRASEEILNDIQAVVVKYIDNNKFEWKKELETEFGNLQRAYLEGGQGPKSVAKNHFYSDISDHLSGLKGGVQRKEENRTALANNHDKVYEKIHECLENGLPITAGSRDTARHIAPKHAYTVIGAYETKDVPAKKMVRIRNPWADSGLQGGISRHYYRKGAIEYTKDGIIAAQKEHGIFDIEFDDFISEMSEIRYNDSQELRSEAFFKEKGYDEIRRDGIESDPADIINDEAYLEYLRCANDIHESLLKTNSLFSKDSQAYTDLVKESQLFREVLVKSRGQKFDVVINAYTKLKDKAQAYEDHVPSDPSRRQRRRASVCETIKLLENPVKNMSKQPRRSFEDKFAKELLLTTNKDKYKNSPVSLADDVITLADSKIFATAMKRFDFHELCNITGSRLNACIESMKAVGKGFGRDKGFEISKLRELRQQEEPVSRTEPNHQENQPERVPVQ